MQEVALRRVLVACLMVMALWLLLAAAAYADRGGDTPLAVVPDGGRPNGLRLRAQTVDLTVKEDSTGVWAGTRVWMQLANPFTRSLSVPVTVAGLASAGSRLPAQVSLKLDGDDLPWEPLAAPALGATTVITVPARGDASLQLDYTQAVSETKGLATLLYPLSATGRWGGTPESQRLTVTFDPPLAPGQLLGRIPEAQRDTAQTLTWTWDTKPAQDVSLGFMTPSWWHNYARAQEAANQPGAGPAEHLALSEFYQQLAALPGLPFAPNVDFYARYYPVAIAELQAAAGAAQEDVVSLPALAARATLARLYRDQARRLGEGPGDIYLELAASEAEVALKGGADSSLRDLALDALTQLAGRATARGDAAKADAYLARVAALQPGNVGSSTQRNQEQARLAVAAAQIARGDLTGARRVLTETFGSAAIELPALRPPAAGQVLVTVETTIDGPSGDPASAEGSSLRGRRRISATLVDTPEMDRAQSLLSQAAVAWRSVAGVTIIPGPSSIALEFPFRDERQLIEIQNRLARLLPNLPELAIVRAALAPEQIAAAASQTRFDRVWHYAESANLAPAVEDWQGRAGEIRAAGLRLAPPQPAASASPGVDPSPTAPAQAAGEPSGRPAGPPTASPAAAPPAELGQVQRALWEANAQAWTHLADRSYVHYAVQLGPSGPAREWQVAAGEVRSLAIERHYWRIDRLLLAAGAALAGVVVLAVLLWRLL